MIKKRESSYECNVYILKMIVEAVMLCSEQRLASLGHRNYGKSESDTDNDNVKKVHQGNYKLRKISLVV